VTNENLADEIIKRLHQNGHEAYLTGGCVRDRLLGRTPKDYDVATAALPGQILEYFPNSVAVGAKFGVVLVPGNEAKVEVATFRCDHDYLDGRRPESVSFTRSAKQDVERRDFTINGMLFDPAQGRCLDYVGGRADLEAGLVRAIGKPRERFAEDRLRMLRAIRFAARLGFAIEVETLRAIQDQAAKIEEISAERIRGELNRVLTEGGARRGFELLDDTGLLEVLLPEVAAMKGVPQPPRFHPEGDVWLHTLLMLSQMDNPSVPLAWGVLLHDVGKPPTLRFAERIRFDGHVEVGVRMAEHILERLRFSHDDRDQVVALVANHMRFMNVMDMRGSTLKKFMRIESFDEHLELHRLDCRGSHGSLDNYEFVRRKLEETPVEELRPPRLLTGGDLIAAGYSPGPAFKEILNRAEDAQLEGVFESKEAALAFVKERFQPPTGKQVRPEK
jgi:putative nucleotidyltransferase with HDIG domain